MQVPHHSFAILSPSTSWFDGYFPNPQYRSVGQISMVLGQYQPFWWNSFSLFGYVEDSPFWIVSDHFGRLKSANLGWSSCLNEFVSLVDTSKWPFYCGKGDITLITLSQFEIYRPTGTYFVCAPESLRNGRNGEVLSRVADDQGFLMVLSLTHGTFEVPTRRTDTHRQCTLMGNKLK